MTDLAGLASLLENFCYKIKDLKLERVVLY